MSDPWYVIIEGVDDLEPVVQAPADPRAPIVLVSIDSMIPINATETQYAMAYAVGQEQITLRANAVLAYIEGQGSTGATPHEVAAALELDINQVRPICTRLHQRGHMHRSFQTRRTPSGKSSYVYIGLAAWTSADGELLSRAHRGVGQEIHPDGRFNEKKVDP